MSWRYQAFGLDAHYLPAPAAQPKQASMGRKERRTRTACSSSRTVRGPAVLGFPVWAEGVVASSGAAGQQTATLSPMGMADVLPPLRFSWRLSPPMPNAPASLVHWLHHFTSDPDEVSPMPSFFIRNGLTSSSFVLPLSAYSELQSTFSMMPIAVGIDVPRHMPILKPLSILIHIYRSHEQICFCRRVCRPV